MHNSSLHNLRENILKYEISSFSIKQSLGLQDAASNPIPPLIKDYESIIDVMENIN